MFGVRLIGLFSIMLLAACNNSATTDVVSTADPEILTATESSRDIGDYTIHFNAITTDQLTAEVAANYGIARSRNRALLNVSVVQNTPSNDVTSVRAEVTATATNLSAQLRNLSIREIADNDAVYYIAETAITNAETLVFTINVTPEGSDETETIRYMQQFFID